MLYQLGNVIMMNRGDTFEFSVNIYDVNEEDHVYKLRDDDAVYFGILDPNQAFENALVKKKLH